MARVLGRQTVTVYEQVRAEFGERADGAVEVWEKCLLVPLPPSEGRVDGRASETRRWRLYAPSGRRASPTAQCTVEPGPTNDAGAPLRLSFATTPAPIWTRKSREAYVSAEVRLVT